MPFNLPVALTKALAQLSADPAAAQRIGRNGRLVAEVQFDLSTNVAKFNGRFRRASERCFMDRRCA